MKLDDLTSGRKDRVGYRGAQLASLRRAVRWIYHQSRQFLVGAVIQDSYMMRFDAANGPMNMDKTLEKIPRLLGTGMERGCDHKRHGEEHRRETALD